MKLTVSRTTLLNALQIVRPTVLQLPVYPINEYAKVVGIGGKLSLSTTNNKESTVHVIDCDGEDISILLPVVWFIDFLKEVPEQPIIIELDGLVLKISAPGLGNYEIATENFSDFPDLPQATGDGVTINASDLKAALFAVSEDQLRPVFTGVFLTENAIQSTDTRILYSKSHSGSASVVIPARIISLLPDCELQVFISKSQICFSNETTQWFSILIDEKIPPINSVIPRDNNIVCEIDRGVLLASLKRVKLFTSTINQAILNISDGQIIVSANNASMAKSGSETINCNLIGEPIKIGFEIGQLIKILSNIRSETIFMYLSKPNIAAIVREQNEPDNLSDLFIIIPSHIGSAL